MEGNLKTSRIRKQEETAGKTAVQFLCDSSEQIERSMETLGPLRDQLYEVFRKAIDRVNKVWQEADRPAIDETRKGDSECEAPWK